MRLLATRKSFVSDDVPYPGGRCTVIMYGLRWNSWLTMTRGDLMEDVMPRRAIDRAVRYPGDSVFHKEDPR